MFSHPQAVIPMCSVYLCTYSYISIQLYINKWTTPSPRSIYSQVSSKTLASTGFHASELFPQQEMQVTQGHESCKHCNEFRLPCCQSSHSVMWATIETHPASKEQTPGRLWPPSSVSSNRTAVWGPRLTVYTGSSHLVQKWEQSQRADMCFIFIIILYWSYHVTLYPGPLFLCALLWRHSRHTTAAEVSANFPLLCLFFTWPHFLRNWRHLLIIICFGSV